MRLPADQREREALFRNTIREAEVSRPDRQALHRRLRTIYLNGQDSLNAAIYNRILEFVDTSASLLYDAEGARFLVETPERYGDAYLEEAEAASDDFQRIWGRRYTNTAALAVEWAHVYPSIVVKVFGDGERTAFELIDDPSDVSVWRDDRGSFESQEAIAHHLHLDLPSFERYIADLGYRGESKESLMAIAREHAVRAASGSLVLPPTQSRLVLSAVSPNAIGAAQVSPIVSMAYPTTVADVVPLTELHVWDDSTGDWHVAMLFRPTETVLMERPNPQPGIDAFYRLCLFPVAGYLWGLSPIERLVGLQEWRDARMADIDHLVKLNLRPPRAFLGISGMNDERAKRLNTPDGQFTSPQPNGKIETLAPPIPPDVWTLVDGIDRMFNRAGGLPPGSDVGAENPGVRAGDQLEAMANLGSPRVRRRAMYVETFLNAVATAIERLRRRGPTRLTKPSSRQDFLLAQMPGDLTVSVAAHSASPLYAERTFERALLMYDRGAIDDETLVTLSGLPMQSRLRAKARLIQKAKGERASEASKLKAEEVQAKVVTADAKMISAKSP